MHPARLAFLAGNHRPARRIVMQERTASGTRLTLECGHTGNCAPHFDCSRTETWLCSECGKDYVLTAPQYAAEFNN